jgi:hypothetical protein
VSLGVARLGDTTLGPAERGVKAIGQFAGVKNQAAFSAKTAPFTFDLDLGGKSPEAFRAELQAAAQTGRWPSPPLVNLSLTVRNDTSREMAAWLGGEDSELHLDLRGPGVQTVQVEKPAFQPLPGRQRVTIAPGGSYAVPIPRLVDGSRRQVRYLYWTKPGIYTLTVHLQTRIAFLEPGTSQKEGLSPRPRLQTFISPPLELHVEAPR